MRVSRPRKALALLALLVGLAASGPSPAQTPFATDLSRQYPNLRALVIARGACVVFEYYRRGLGPESRSPVYSVTKSVLSILIGVAIDKGYLRLDEKLSEILPETSDPAVDPAMREVTIRDLLTMTGGFDRSPETEVGAPADSSWRWLLQGRLQDAPGSRFHYDGKGPNLLSVALSRAARQGGEAFARRYLFDPLRIQNFVWVSDAGGHLIGDTDLFLTARDMAKIGLLYLQRGRWNGAQLISSDYVLDSTRAHNDGGPPIGAAYGYLWWIGRTPSQLPAFFAAGIKSQQILVAPGRGLVVALAADAIPEGAKAFIDDVVLPGEAAIPPSAPCLETLER